MGTLQINKSVFWWWNFNVRWWNSGIVYLPLFLSVIFDDHQLVSHGGNFQIIRAKKWALMSTHHISTTFSWRCEQLLTKKFDIISALLEKYAKYNWFNIVMKMWFRYFSLNHITITISLQCWENVFCPITKSSHFYHNAREMYLVNILGWKCDVEVKGAWNLLNHKSTLLW